MSAFVNNSMTPVQFYEDTIYYVEKDGEQYVPMRPIIENMGLAWNSQYTKLVNARNRWSVMMIITVAPDGKSRETLCIPLRKLTGFLATINPDKVNEDLREKLVRYQNECDEVLFQYWTKGQLSKEDTYQYSLKDRLEAARLLFETAHLEGNQLTLAIDKIHRREVGYSALEAANVALISPKQELALTPTEIGKQLTPELTPVKVNRMLADAGYQHKVADKWEPLPKAAAMCELLDTGKKHSNGTPIKQLKWYSSIIPVIQAMMNTTE